MTDPKTAAAADASTRVVDGEKQHRFRTTRGVAFFFRTLVAQGGWYQGAKEFSRARKLAKAIPKLDPPKDGVAEWEDEPCDFWLTERQREHGKKCATFFLDRGSFSAAPDNDAIEPFLIDLGLVLKDD